MHWHYIVKIQYKKLLYPIKFRLCCKDCNRGEYKYQLA